MHTMFSTYNNGASDTEVSVKASRTGELASSSDIKQMIPDYQSAGELFAAYGNFSGVTGGDFVTKVNTSNGQSIIAITSDPLVPSEAVVVLNTPVKQPAAVELEASMIRNRQQFATFTLFENDAVGADVIPAPINIVSIYQSTADFGSVYSATAGTIVTVVLESPMPDIGNPGAVYLSDWVNITDLVDSRLNYQNLCIKWISIDRKTFTAGFADETALPSIAVTITPTLGQGKVNFYNNMSGAKNGFGIRFTGTNATSAALVSIFNGGDVQVSGTLLGDHRVSIGSTAPNYVVGTMGQYEIKASSRYRLEGRPSECIFSDKPSDSSTNYTVRQVRSAVKPAMQSMLRPRFRLFQAPGMSKLVAKITSISKAGTTTATVNTAEPHGLVTGNYVVIKGVRDNVNFAPTNNGAIITVTSPTQFTFTHGSAATATSYGGSVGIINGSSDIPGSNPNNIQSIAYASGSNNSWLSIVGYGSWSGLNVGDYINLHGVRLDTSGLDCEVDGAWEVANLSGGTLTVKPIFDIYGTRRSPLPTGTKFGNCGGSVIIRTTLRAHDILMEEWVENKVMIDGQGTTRIDKSIPVYLVANSAPSMVKGEVAVDSVMGQPVPIGFRASNANIASMSATGDLVGALATMIGALINKPFSLPEADWTFTGTLTTNTDVVAKAAGGAFIKQYITAMQLQNTNAVATTISVKDGSTVKWTVSLPANMSTAYNVEFPTPMQSTANTALNIICGTTGANVLTNIQGYTAP